MFRSFVRANGTGFALDGKPFAIAGGNNYYAAQANEAAARAVFSLATQMRLNVLRTWAFLDCGSGSVESVPEGSSDGVFFQYWDGEQQDSAFNDGANGLERLDQAIALAEEFGIRLILTLANNWPDFGGVPQYLRWFGLKEHRRFFSDPRVRRAYREYVEHILTRVNTRTGRRYADEPAILAWELMNEPRCPGARGNEILTAWIEEMSAFSKSLDGNHLTCVGDEGFFRRARAGRNALYNGSHGVDCERILGLPAVDFGTYHLYPSLNAREDPVSFGKRWIREHIEAGQRANKPMLLEEYGLKTASQSSVERQRRDDVFRAWLEQIRESGGSGAVVWMIASTWENGQLYPDYDGYTVHSAEEVPSVCSSSEIAMPGRCGL